MSHEARHLACSLTATLLQRVARMGGEDSVSRVLAIAGCPHSAAYLHDPSNWVSYDMGIALFGAAIEVTEDPGIARTAGEDTVRQHAGTAVATVFRSMGAPEKILQQVTTAVTKFSVVTEMESLEVEPGRALVRGRARPGFARHAYLCDWTKGLLSQPTVLFGLPPASVEETECAARGGSQCLYEVRWDATAAARASNHEHHLSALEAQLGAIALRVDSVLDTAADLIADENLDTTLARITDRAATAVRAPKYLLAVQTTPEGDLHCHHRGLTDDDAGRLVARLKSGDAHPANWLVASVRSGLRDYGHLVALQETDDGFFAQEREMFTVYARYAATALDRATALSEARDRRDEAQALLELARALAAAGGSDEVAQRLVAAIPAVVDCDRAGVFLWDTEARELRSPAGTDDRMRDLRVRPRDTPYLQAMLDATDPAALYFDESTDDPYMRGLMRSFGDLAILVIPVVARGTFLGVLSVGVSEHPERIRPRPELLDRLSGVVAQTATALQNGQLIDRVTHQAHNDGLTGLANREHFGQCFEAAASELARSGDDSRMALFYVDLDRFKSVNDAYGHAAGDELLCAVADRLRLTVRGGDTVARLGGDEFAVLLRGARRPQEFEAVARRIGEAFAEPFLVDGVALTVGASVGRAIWPAEATDLDRLLQTADTDMYRHKRERSFAGAGPAHDE
jgi:diguanylate cyclase (GGDEF)-like protein